jgi:hypothetical protein
MANIDNILNEDFEVGLGESGRPSVMQNNYDDQSDFFNQSR